MPILPVLRLLLPLASVEGGRTFGRFIASLSAADGGVLGQHWSFWSGYGAVKRWKSFTPVVSFHFTTFHL